MERATNDIFQLWADGTLFKLQIRHSNEATKRELALVKLVVLFDGLKFLLGLVAGLWRTHDFYANPGECDS